MYKVIETFHDTEHGCVYFKGTTYPGPGEAATPERITYLSGSDNKLGRPVIEPVEPVSNRKRGGASTQAPAAPEETMAEPGTRAKAAD